MNSTTTSWNDTQKLLSFIIVVALILVILIWMFRPPTGDQSSMTVLNMLLGSLVGLAGMVVTFYFGSSRGERTKDSTIAGLTTAPSANGNSSGHTDPATPATPPQG